MFRFNGHKRSYLTALSAYRSSRIVSKNPALAPIGAFHFWELDGVPAGHVGQDMTGGGRQVFMAAGTLAVLLGAFGLGFVSVGDYTRRKKGSRYLGWSTSYGTQPARKADDTGKHPAITLAGVTKKETDAAKVKRIARYLNKRRLGRVTSAERDGRRMDPGKTSSNYWWLIQTAAWRDGRYGRGYLRDGKPGPKTRALEVHYSKIAK